MDDHNRELLAFLDNVHRQKRHPFAEFLQSLRSSANNCIFGVGELAPHIYEKLSRPEIGVKIHCCCDNDARKWGQTFFGDVPCISLPELLAMKDQVTVLIVTGYFERGLCSITAPGVGHLYVFNKEYLIIHAAELARRVKDAAEYARFREQVVALMALMADEQSRRTAAAVICNWFRSTPFEGDYREICVPDQYFPADVVRLSDREVFLDLGAFDGKNTLDFIERTGGRFGAAYAFELDAANFASMTKTFQSRVDRDRAYSVKGVPSPSSLRDAIAESGEPDRTGGSVFLCRVGAGSRNEEIRYRSQAKGSLIDASGECVADIIRIDDIFSRHRVTFLKMDIEGAEMEALEGAKETIRRWKPKIAACVYHNPDHLLQMPIFLRNLVPEYRFYLRHHTKAYFETVCYAIC